VRPWQVCRGGTYTRHPASGIRHPVPSSLVVVCLAAHLSGCSSDEPPRRTAREQQAFGNQTADAGALGARADSVLGSARPVEAGRQGRFAWLGPKEAELRWQEPLGAAAVALWPLSDETLLVLGGSASWRIALDGVASREDAVGADVSMDVGWGGTVLLAGAARVSGLAPDGAEQWRHLWSRPGEVRITARALGGAIVTDGAGAITAFGSHGDVAWSRSMPAPIIGGPAASPFEHLSVATSDGRVHAIDGRDGSARWTRKLTGVARGTPVVSLRGEVVVGTTAGLEAFAADGRPRWKVPMDGGALEPAVASRSRMYVLSAKGALSSVSSEGAVDWAISLGAAASLPPVVDLDRVVYAMTDDGVLHAVRDEGANPEREWSLALSARAVARPVLAPGGVLYAGLADGSVAAVGRPLTGYRGTCELWTTSGPACTQACTKCEAELEGCLSDPGCERIARCVLETGCATPGGCDLPTTCRGAIERAGGMHSPSFRRATALGRCAASACLGGLR
jgi:hypothetical protein